MKVYAVELLENPLNVNTLDSLIIGIVDGIVLILIPIMVLAVVWTGFNLVINSKKPEELSKSKNSLMWSLVGLLLVLGANGVLEIVKNTVNSVTS